MIKESDIRSDKTLKEYQKLVDQDSRKLLKRKKNFKSINLKKLGLGKMTYAFTKKGYDYLECSKTGTLIVNPRPTKKDLFKFYKIQNLTNFGTKNFFTDAKTKSKFYD